MQTIHKLIQDNVNGKSGGTSMRIHIQRLSVLSVSVVFAFFAEMAVAITATPTLTPTATYTPTSSPTNRYTPTILPQPSVTPAALGVMRRAHTGTSSNWYPHINDAKYSGDCELVSLPAHGSATCAVLDSATGKLEPGKYLSESGYIGPDSFEYRFRLSTGDLTNAAKVDMEVTKPCEGIGCYSLKSLGPSQQIRSSNSYGQMKINDHGEVAFIVGPGCYAYFWSPTTNTFIAMDDILTPLFGANAYTMCVIDLNNSSRVISVFHPAGGYSSLSGLYAINPHTREVSGRAPYLPDIGTIAINNLGQVVYYDQSIFIWDSFTGDNITVVQNPLWPSTYKGHSADINDSGRVAGSSYFADSTEVFLWDNNTGYISAGTLPNSYWNLPTALNNRDQITGYAVGATTYSNQAFIWQQSSGMKGLGFLSAADRPSTTYPYILKPFSYAWGLSDFGTVVGRTSSDFDTDVERYAEGFVWSDSAGMSPLFHHLNSTGAGWDVIPYSSSDSGLVVGVGRSATSTDDELVILSPIRVLSVGDVSIKGISGEKLNWTPILLDAQGKMLKCRIATPPQNGSVTVTSNCSSGTYQSNPGFIGTDSFTYIANDGQTNSNPGTVTVAVSEGSVDQVCVQNNPQSQFSQTGKEGTITISFTGNITSHTNKVVKLCPGTTLKYNTTSTQGSVVCKVKNNTTRGSGRLKINDHIKCTDKPAGKDKLGFKVKSGVK